MLTDKVKKDMACDRIGRKLVKYLEENRATGIIDFRLRIDSDTHFYIHPQDKDGVTLDIDWDIKKANYGSEVFGHTNTGEEQDKNFTVRLKAAIDKRMTECAIFTAMLNNSEDYDVYKATRARFFDSLDDIELSYLQGRKQKEK